MDLKNNTTKKPVLKFELSQKDIRVKNILNKEFLMLDIYAISDIYPNRNASAFTKESLELSKQTCYNKPILGSFDTIRDDFREHNGEQRYDDEFETTYWDCSGDKDEKILGVIRESDSIQVVEEDNHNWLKISCALWTYYTYKQVKKLLKSSTKKVSVEILVEKYHMDESDIMVIDQFTLTGVTILGDSVREGIPNAHLNVVDMMKESVYSQQMKCLSFAYNNQNKEKDIKHDDKTSVLYNKQSLEGKTVTYREKLEVLSRALSSVYSNSGENDNENFWICDFSDEFVIIRDYSENKYYKITYSSNEDSFNFNLDSKVEQVEAFVDAPKRTITINGEEKSFNEVEDFCQKMQDDYANIQEQYNEMEGNYNNVKQEFEDFQEEMKGKKFSIVVDEQEYDIDQIYEKYQTEVAEKSNAIDQMKADSKSMQEQFDATVAELNELKEKIEMAEKEKLAEDGCKMVDEEEELDEDDKEEIKNNCHENKYSSLDDIETAIAKCLYTKKKSKRQSNFSYETGHDSHLGEKSKKSSADLLKDYINN